MRIKTFGNSMLPFFQDGDVLTLKKVRFVSIRIDDFITSRVGTKLVTHRVVYRTTRFLITKGDNNISIDPRVTSDKVVGKVIEVTRHGVAFDPYELSLVQSGYYLAEIQRVATALKNATVNFAVLKGLPLHLRYEHNFPKRFFSDCDLLVDKAQFPLVAAVLKSLGYTVYRDQIAAGIGTHPSQEPEVQFVKKIHGLSVTFDIHLEAVFLMTRLRRSEGLYPQALLSRYTQALLTEKQKVLIDGYEYPLLSIPHQIVYLALHLFHHNFKGYYRYELLVRILAFRKLQSDVILRILTTYKLGSFVSPIFWILTRYYGSKSAGLLYGLLQPGALKQNTSKLTLPKILSEDYRVQAGISRFLHLFSYSPQPIYKKISILWESDVWHAVWWVLRNRYENMFRK